jgi:sugar phosphate isomerase/epimerase
MKIGVSTYSLSRAIRTKEMSVLEVMEYIAEIGGQHVEIVPIGFNLNENPELIDQIRDKASQLHIEISNYAIGANFTDINEQEYEKEIERVMAEVDIAHRLGVKLMRHDAASSKDLSIRNFLKDLPRISEACRRIADYANQYEITTSVENHGYYVQASDRVQALINQVDRPNYKTTLDIGNFMCVDEEPTAAVRKNISYASMVHIKDFYLRPAAHELAEGWFKTQSGNLLRGAIIGHGDIPMREVLRIIKQSGYDGYISIEFEGLEDCKLGTRLGLEYVNKEWNNL